MNGGIPLAPGEFRSGFIAIMGRPNTGKSTLINSLVGQKIAIASEKPQTTRNRILGVLTTERYQMVFLDTPGLMSPATRLDKFMLRVAESTAEGVDVILLVVDGSRPPAQAERDFGARLGKKRVPVILVVNKIDLLSPEQVSQALETYRQALAVRDVAAPRETVAVSALHQTHLSALLDAIHAHLPEGPKYYPADMVTDQPDRFYVAEIIREKALEVLREEVPYALAAVVEEILPRREDLLFIRAYVFCEKAGQKGILIGEKGQRLKIIGSRARQELEAHFGKRIFLDLWVKVKKDWRDDPVELEQLGYRLT